VAITLIGFVLSINTAYADNLDVVKLHDLDNSLKHHSGNIITLKQEPTSEQNVNDGEYSNSVLSVLSEISIESENLIENQSLSGEKESAPEKPEVKTRENDGLKLLKGKCGSYLDEINLNLNRITNSAINFEVKNARDDVVKICAIIQCCK
jgi:hypothetical protein